MTGKIFEIEKLEARDVIATSCLTGLLHMTNLSSHSTSFGFYGDTYKFEDGEWVLVGKTKNTGLPEGQDHWDRDILMQYGLRSDQMGNSDLRNKAVKAMKDAGVWLAQDESGKWYICESTHTLNAQ